MRGEQGGVAWNRFPRQQQCFDQSGLACDLETSVSAKITRTIMIFHRIHPNPEIQSHLDQAVELRAEFIRACFRSFARWGVRWFHVSRSIL